MLFENKVNFVILCSAKLNSIFDFFLTELDRARRRERGGGGG